MCRWVLLTTVLATACAVPIKATISPEGLRREVARAEARRDGQAPAIRRAGGAAQKELRIAALAAIARAAQPGTASVAISLLGDRDPEVATWAAFALSRLGEPAGEMALWNVARGAVSVVPERAVLALGQSGTATVGPHLLGLLDDARLPVRAAAALSLGLLAKRLPNTLVGEAYVQKLASLVSSPDREVRFGAVYALFRLGGSPAAVALIPALADPEPEIRAHAVRGLAAGKASPHVLDPVANDPDWRVRAEVAKALGVMGAAHPDEGKAAVARLLAIIPREFARFRHDPLAAGRATHVLRELIGAAAQLGVDGRRVLDALERAPWTTEGLGEATIADQARLNCALAFALDRADGEIRRVRSCGAAGVDEWRRLELVARLLGSRGDERAVEQLGNLTVHQDPRVRVAAASALGEIPTEGASTALLRLLDSNDPFLRGAAIELLAQPGRTRSPGFLTRIEAQLRAIKPDDDPSLLVGLLDASGGLGPEGAPLLPALSALLDDPRPAIRRRAAEAVAKIRPGPVPLRPADPPTGLPAPEPRRVFLGLDTDRGEVVIELFGDVAPVTTGVVVELARSGFYDGKTFHRIVTDFVAQGGCPRGDGWGGPGYAIPSEGSPLPFVRGAVGMATNGLDTGGSQFFIMHSYHPHLDGNYTLVGRVESGIEVVDALQEDDRILSAKVLSSPTR